MDTADFLGMDKLMAACAVWLTTCVYNEGQVEAALLSGFQKLNAQLQLTCLDHADPDMFRLLSELAKTHPTEAQYHKQLRGLFNGDHYRESMHGESAATRYKAVWRARFAIKDFVDSQQTTCLWRQVHLRSVQITNNKMALFIDASSYVQKVAFSPDFRFISILDVEHVLMVLDIHSPSFNVKLLLSGVFDATFGDERNLFTSHKDGWRSWAMGATVSLQFLKRCTGDAKLISLPGFLLSIPNRRWQWNGTRMVPPIQDDNPRCWTLRPTVTMQDFHSMTGCLEASSSRNGDHVVWRTASAVRLRQRDLNGAWKERSLRTGSVSPSGINSLTMSPNGQIVVAVNCDCALVWWLDSGHMLRSPISASFAAISPDSQLLALVEAEPLRWDKPSFGFRRDWITIRHIREISGFKKLARFQVNGMRRPSNMRVAWSPDGCF